MWIPVKKIQGTSLVAKYHSQSTPGPISVASIQLQAQQGNNWYKLYYLTLIIVGICMITVDGLHIGTIYDCIIIYDL